jgi:hypothetical protein
MTENEKSKNDGLPTWLKLLIVILILIWLFNVFGFIYSKISWCYDLNVAAHYFLPVSICSPIIGVISVLSCHRGNRTLSIFLLVALILFQIAMTLYPSLVLLLALGWGC